ncbi:MAG: asparagine synthase-related protein [Gemmatimonadota bacterium]|nr:asparagine synthase-related protein [Gemmatimonadota bacterium]
MSGIFGFASPEPLRHPGGVLQAMDEALPRGFERLAGGWYDTEGHAGLAAVRSRHTRGRRFARCPFSGVTCVLDGHLDDGPGGHPGDAEGLLRSFLESGAGVAAGCTGSFNVAWWDPRGPELTVLNDRLGHRLLYWAQHRGALAFGTRIDRIAGSGLVPLRLDPAGVGELLAFLSLQGSRTVLAGVSVLPPGTCLTWTPPGFRTRRYWRMDEVEQHGRYDRARLRDLESALLRTVQRSLDSGNRPAVALTGGFDSRCVAAAAAHLGAADAFTEGDPESLDARIAGEVAARLGMHHEVLPVPEERLPAWLASGARLAGAGVPMLDVQPLQQVFGRPFYDAALVGTSGEAARAAFPMPSSFRRPTLAEARARILQHVLSPTARRGQLDELLLREHAAEAGVEACLGRLDGILASYGTQESPLDACDLYFLEERSRRYLNKGPLLAGPGIEVRLPFLDHDWVRAILSLPTSERLRNRIQLDLVHRLAPALRGQSFEHPRAATTIRQERMAARRKAWRRRLPQALGTPSPPRAFDLRAWSLGPLRKDLRGRLYDEGAAHRRFLSWDRLRPLLDAHFHATANETQLVAALYTLEVAAEAWERPGQTVERRPESFACQAAPTMESGA